MSDALAQFLELQKELQRVRETNRINYYKPYQWQERFHNAVGHQTGLPASEKAAICANQIGKCVSVRTKIAHPDGSSTEAGDLYSRREAFQVLSWDGEKLVEARAVGFIKKPAETIYRLYLESGDWFECAWNHRVLATDGWRFAGQLLASVPRLPANGSALVLSVLGAGALRWFGRLLGSRGDCLEDSHYGDGRLHWGADSGPVFALPLGGALERTSIVSHGDDLAGGCTSSGLRVSDRRANLYGPPQSGGRFSGYLNRVLESISPGCRESIRGVARLSSAVAAGLRSLLERLLGRNGSLPALVSPVVGSNRIIAYSVIGTEEVYDFSVPDYQNYLAGGAIHHNTLSAACEVAFHLTGIYPDWYKGTRFRVPVDWIVAGVTNEVTRDICQNELFGDPKEDAKLGTGTVPKHLIGPVSRKPGVPNAFETVQVKHVTGRWSSVSFKCYEQGPKKFMGLRSNGGWLDEEPPEEILSQVRRSVFSKNPSLILMTFTPEEGATKVVIQLLDQPARGQAVIRATWEDAPHMTEEMKAQKLATIPEHEREMRTKGEPFAGAGLVFPVLESAIVVDPFEIPAHFRQIGSMDFGYDHPFAACRTVYDADNDVAYLANEYYVSRQTPAIHVDAVKPWGDWLPWVWPADGLQTEKGSGTALHLQYRQRGLYMLPHHFTNPPNFVEGQQEGQGGIGVEPGLIEMLGRMQTGRYKVFKTCQKFLQERRSYHRDQHGKVVKINDDVISAARYGLMSLRHARTKPVKKVRRDSVAGLSNWG